MRHGCVYVARIVRRTLANTQRFQGMTALMLQVIRLLAYAVCLLNVIAGMLDGS